MSTMSLKYAPLVLPNPDLESGEADRFQKANKSSIVIAFFVLLTVGVASLIAFSTYGSLLRFGFDNTIVNKEYNYPLKGLENLVMVAGHSVYMSTSCGGFENESSWYLEPYQRVPGQAKTFVDHIRVGVEAAGDDNKALLLFSGGETRKDAGPRSEAQTYWLVADADHWFGHEDVKARTLTEENARDSFENVLFSVCRFRELTGAYPKKITVVSYDFKKERFSGLHRSALAYPKDSFFFIGTPLPESAMPGALIGENNTINSFSKDPYGCKNPLREKKLGRDPFHRTVPYPKGCPELKGLFQYCGPAPYPGHLPWKKH